MPVTIDWYDNEQRIVCFRINGHWTWDEIEPLVERSHEMFASVSHNYPIHSVVDLMDADFYIPINSIDNVKEIAKNQAPNSGLTVFVSNSSVVNQVYQLLCQMMNFTSQLVDPTAMNFKQYFRHVTTLEAAEIMIEKSIAEENKEIT